MNISNLDVLYAKLRGHVGYYDWEA